VRSLSIDSPAKLNLFLRVLGKRPDGYHELCTLFHRISLQDTLKLEKRPEGIRLICSHPEVPQKGNLITRAFDLLKKEYPFQGGVTVRLTKRIPVGGGLGGGSSNAAALLLGMNRLYHLGLSRQKLVGLGKQLGADVPFFLSEARHALGKGRGDEIRPLRFQKKLGFILLPDHGGLSTKRVYRRLRFGERRRSLTGVSRVARITSAFLAQGRLAEATPFLVNDLAGSAESLRPSLKHRRRIASELQLGACQISGSGPTLFILFASPTQARKAFSRFRRHSTFKQAILCHSL
jgi:4-diphosphocytidyl-2-C-methyl-D-erythritol kinase